MIDLRTGEGNEKGESGNGVIELNYRCDVLPAILSGSEVAMPRHLSRLR